MRAHLGTALDPPADSPDQLVVDVQAGSFAAGARVIRGRPVACAVLAHLAGAGGRAVSAADFYRRVWQGREYHPLRHRNTIYVALSRLRRTLAELLPDRPVIERVPAGWRLAPGVRVSVVSGAS